MQGDKRYVKIAMLMLCHKNSNQVNQMIDSLRHPSISFYIHVDKKSDIGPSIKRSENVFFVPENNRVNVRWGSISQVDASINLMRFAQQHCEYDYYWLCSGQDLPIKQVDTIVNWFKKHNGHDFYELFKSRNTGLSCENNYDKRNAIFFPKWILGKGAMRRIVKRVYTELTGGYNRTYNWAKRAPVNNLQFYFGSSWVCLHNNTIKWIMRYLKDHPEYYRFFMNCNCPDESFFQTLAMNSPYKENRMDYLHYVDWSEGNNNPKTLKIEDKEKLFRSDKLLARKFDSTVDNQIIEEILQHISSTDT